MIPVRSITLGGATGMLVDIECRLSNNLPTIVIVGFANRAVGEAKERIRGAFASSRILLPRKRITVNLAPADVPKADSGFDLAIAVAIIAADGQLDSESSHKARISGAAFIGELGLDGNTRPVRGIIGRILAGRAKGIRIFYIPAANLEQALLVPHVKLVPISSLAELYHGLRGEKSYEILHGNKDDHIKPSAPDPPKVSFSEIVGQHRAKRALEISAAGGHNIFLDGPPGTGKSMLARALPGLLPPLNREEMLEVTQLHSLASPEYEDIVTRRPFRAPHHSASLTSITGGGIRLHPGEISLAHRGVLFFDEFPEFNRQTLEALRQPLEDRTVNVTRAHGTAAYPANFIFAAASNPCPCGYFGSDTPCECTEPRRLAYRNRLSGPILDRIDLYSEVHAVEHKRLLADAAEGETDMAIRDRITKARAIQTLRFGSGTKLNSDMTNSDIKKCVPLDAKARNIFDQAAENLHITARGYMRLLRVARTIADLGTEDIITAQHISEALSYRPRALQ